MPSKNKVGYLTTASEARAMVKALEQSPFKLKGNLGDIIHAGHVKHGTVFSAAWGDNQVHVIHHKDLFITN